MKPQCPHFFVCGGCQLQELPYGAQVQQKSEYLSRLFGFSVSVEPNPMPFRYRNRMDFAVSPDVIGLRASQGFDLTDVSQCHLISPQMEKLFVHSKKVVCSMEIQDSLRYITVREGEGLQLILTTKKELSSSLCADIASSFNIASVVFQLASSDTTQGEVYSVSGDANLRMIVSGVSFLSSHNCFFQSSLASFSQAIECMRPFVEGKVLDLFCGVGVIGMALNPQLLVSVEASEAAVALAQENARALNSSANIIAGDATRVLVEESFDTVIVDPPRTGLRQGALQLLRASPKRIVYLSCNPVSQRKDLISLRQKYNVIFAKGFDFFPQTNHVESLIVLERK